MTNLCTVRLQLHSKNVVSVFMKEESMDKVMIIILGSNRFPMTIHPPSPLYIGAKPPVKYWLIFVLGLRPRHATIID